MPLFPIKNAQVVQDQVQGSGRNSDCAPKPAKLQH